MGIFALVDVVIHGGRLTRLGVSREFQGCFAKVERAREHIDALQEEIAAFVADHPYDVVVEFDSETGEQIARVATVKEPPLRWSIIFGELGHNLRSALDHLVYQLAIIAGSNPAKTKTSFPIYTSCRAYWTPRKSQPSPRDVALEGVSDNARALIDSAQPYHGGDSAQSHPLATLAWLTNIDKHRLVHGVLVRGIGQGVMAAPRRSEGRIAAFESSLIEGSRLEAGTELARVRMAR